MQMIVIKTIIGIVIGISIIAIPLIALYVLGRITIPLLDPEWNQFGKPHPILIMLAGLAAAASVLAMFTALVVAAAIGEHVIRML